MLCDSLRLDELDGLRGQASVVRCRASAMEAVRKCLRALCTTIRGGGSPTEHDFVEQATRDLPSRLMSAIATSHPSCSLETSRKRELAFDPRRKLHRAVRARRHYHR